MEWNTIERLTQGPVTGLLVPFEVAIRKVLDAQQFPVNAEALRSHFRRWLKEVGNTEGAHGGRTPWISSVSGSTGCVG